MRPFEIGLIGIFGIVAVFGLVFLSNFQSNSSSTSIYGSEVLIWGTLDAEPFQNLLNKLSQTDKGLKVVRYVEIDSRTFEQDLLNAIADGQSPDLIVLPHELLVTYRTKLQAISSDTIDLRTFRNRYIDGAEIFMLSDGLYGIPFAVDPLLMYWNRDIVSSSGLVTPPDTWERLVSETVPKTVRIDSRYNVIQSAVAFGEYENITHAKEVLGMLLLQAGASIVTEVAGEYRVSMNATTPHSLPPGEAVFGFFSQFTTPGKELYSWNRSKQLDRTEFSAGNLALYFGKGSERDEILLQNSNLNFDVAPIPQGEGATIKRNYGDFYAFSIPRASDNVQGAFAVASLLSDQTHVRSLTDALGFAPVDRSFFDGSETDPFRVVVFQTALISRGWLDPNPKETDLLFKTVVEDISSGRDTLKSISLDIARSLEALFR